MKIAALFVTAFGALLLVIAGWEYRVVDLECAASRSVLSGFCIVSGLTLFFLPSRRPRARVAKPVRPPSAHQSRPFARNTVLPHVPESAPRVAQSDMSDEPDNRPDESDNMNPYASPRTPCTSTDEALPAALAAKIDRLLEPGEAIVWEGRAQFPVKRFLVLTLVEAVFLFGLLLAIARFAAPDPILIAGLLFMFILTIACASMFGFLAVRNTALVLTTHRMINYIGLPLFGDRVQSYLPEEVNWKSRPIRLLTSSPRVAPHEQAYHAAPPWYLSSQGADSTRIRNLVCDTLLPELARRLRHTDPLIRRRSAACLARMGPAAANFAQSLIATLRDDDGVVRRHSCVALGNGRVGSARAELERLRFDDDRRVAQAAINALDRLPALAKPTELSSRA